MVELGEIIIPAVPSADREHQMKAISLGVVFVLFSISAVAQSTNCTTTKIGNYTYTNCSDGTSYNSSKIGETRYYNGDITGSTNKIGQFEYHNFSDRKGNRMNGSSNRIGNFEYHNFNDNSGNSYYGSTNQIGDNSYFNLNGTDGSSLYGTSSQIGGSSYSNYWDDED